MAYEAMFATNMRRMKTGYGRITMCGIVVEEASCKGGGGRGFES
jgi:hypothetical protein